MSGFRLTPRYPSLAPSMVDPIWFQVDRPKDEEQELTRLEREIQNRKKLIATACSDINPIGKVIFQWLRLTYQS